MNALLERLRAFFTSASSSMRPFWEKNRAIVLGGFTILSILLIVWARLGFSFDVSRFSAAPPPSTLQIQCSGSTATLTWNIPSGATVNAVQKNVNGQGWQFLNISPGQTSYVDQSPAGAIWRHKTDPNVVSNTVSCPTATVTPTPATSSSPTPSPTLITEATLTPFPTVSAVPTPTATATSVPVACAPQSQTVVVNQPATLQASGGNGTYQWSVESQSKQGASVTFLFTSAGTRSVTVLSGSSTATCQVTVNALSAGALSLLVSGKNASTGSGETGDVNASPGQQVEVIAHIQNTQSAGNLQSVTARASLPNGIAYIPASTTINNAGVSADTLSSTGISLGALGPQQEAVVRFRVRVDTQAFPVGTSQAILIVQTEADGATPRSSSLTITVQRGSTGGVGTVPTGPGDAVAVALLISAITTLLYVSYTRSPAFHRREAQHSTERQGPMDFRS